MDRWNLRGAACDGRDHQGVTLRVSDCLFDDESKFIKLNLYLSHAAHLQIQLLANLAELIVDDG